MSDASIQVEYNQELDELAEVMSGVRRPGDFYVSGSLVAPMPHLEIKGVGTVSFPVPSAQAREIIQQAEPAPYGKGEQTVIDTKVRKVWQVAPGKIRLGGSWTDTLDTILKHVARGLGCQEVSVSAELYKLLLYDPGSFFISHRDTEKAPGMFGTLVIVLPSFHEGGELIVRHAGREVPLDLRTQETSQLTYGAFYADCEHEVRPITKGTRVCLIYNLIQRPKGKRRQPPLAAPDYETEITAATKLLKKWTRSTTTKPKMVYLLEHQYTPTSLSFAGLKNADAALSQVLIQAARQAGCAVHLGIVHIEESGAAELGYDSYFDRYGYGHDDSDDEEDDTGAEFEVIEVSDSQQYISEWVDLEDRPVDFGQIPVGSGELLPEGALDNEKPDKQRVTEATGNEGASFERSYHRAAIVLWPEARYPEVLLQAGVGAVLPYFRKRIHAWSNQASTTRQDETRAIISLAKRIIQSWEPSHDYLGFSGLGRPEEGQPKQRGEMLELLCAIQDTNLIQLFIEKIVIPKYDGTENAELVACSGLLGAQKTGALFSTLVEKQMRFFHGACVDLLKRMVQSRDRQSTKTLAAAHRKIAATVIQALATVKPRTEDEDDEAAFLDPDWWRAEHAQPLDATLVVNLFEALRELKPDDLQKQAAAQLAARPEAFAPDTRLVPALLRLYQYDAKIGSAPAFITLWQHAAEFLLARSEFPPEPPKDWAQPVNLGNHCPDCRELQAFAADPDQKVHRFTVRKERRRHLHQIIDRHRLDMTHKTERIGSPQTLVCTKTRHGYQQRCRQYEADVDAFKTLVTMAKKLPKTSESLLARIQAAIRRKK